MATAPAPRPTASSTPRNYLSEITSAGSGLPNRYVFHAVEGWGKTSLAAQAPKPIFIQSLGETGLETLIDAKQLKETPHFPEAKTFDEVCGYLKSLRDGEHDHRTAVVDTLNGVERLIHEHVCQRDFNGDWGESGFEGYKRGYEISLADVRVFLTLLDELRSKRSMSVVLLSHTRVKPFKNPIGADFDRYNPDMHEKTWSLVHKWADAVFFGNFETQVTGIVKNKKTGAERGKAVDATQARILYTQKHAAYDAKNRLGLPEEIEMGDSAVVGWQNLITEIKAAKAAGEPKQ